MSKSVFYSLVSIIMISCTASKQAPSTIGVKNLPNYVLNENVKTAEEKIFKVFTNSADFEKFFHMTKSTPATVQVPDFDAQIVVAVIFKTTRKVFSPKFAKAEILKKELNIHYIFTDTASWTTYEHIPAAIATIPKSTELKQVNFYEVNIKAGTVRVQ